MTARFPIFSPCLIPVSTASRKWNPTRMRERPFSSSAWEKLVYERSTGDGSVQVLPAGNVKLQVVKLMSSVPKNRLRTPAAAPPSTECAES